MPKIPEGAKRPSDHKSSDEDRFTFTHGGQSHTSRPYLDVLTPKWLRANRRRDETDFAFTLLEALFEGDEAAMGALDSMGWPKFNETAGAVMDDMKARVEVSLGE